MLKAIVMDFDGLIVDTEVLWYDISRAWFQKEANYELTKDEFMICVGSNISMLFDLLKSKGIQIDQEEYSRSTQSLFVQRCQTIEPREGVVDFIHGVKDSGLSLALATSSSKPKPYNLLTRFGLLEEFDALITAEDVERIKPHPDLFLKAAETLCIHPDEALVVEDSSHGLMAAQAAGIRTLIITNDITAGQNFSGCFRQDKSLANISINTLIDDFNTTCS